MRLSTSSKLVFFVSNGLAMKLNILIDRYCFRVNAFVVIIMYASITLSELTDEHNNL